LKLECVSPVSVMCIMAKAIFMVDFDDFGWLFMVVVLLESEREERGREGERENINEKSVTR
jgi:hypothetical protein